MRQLIDLPSSPSEKTHVEKAPAHDSAREHVSGTARYTDDIYQQTATLHLALGISTRANAEITKIDLGSVRSAPGVIDVFTSEDIPGHNEVGAVFPGDPLLVDGYVSYAGQPIFAVVADTLRHARQATGLARIEYREKPPLLDPVVAIKEHSVVLPKHVQRREAGQNIVDEAQRESPLSALETSQYRVSGSLDSGGQEHFYLEGQIAIAEPWEDNGLRIVTSTQHPSEVQKLVAKVIGLPLHRIVAEVRRMGGGFGGKESQAAAVGVMAALACWRTGRSIKFRMPREIDMRVTGKRHPFHSTYDVGFNDSGIIQAAKIELIGNCGYSPDLSEGVVDRAMFHADNAYYIGDALVIGHRARTNTVSHTAFRGFGGPQGMLPIETAMDDIARKLGVDPLDIRKRNLYRAGKDETHYGQRIEQHLIGPMMETLEKQSDYRTRRQQITKFNRNSPVIKRGLALTPVQFGISFTATHLNQAGAIIRIYTDGSVLINHGGTEMGQGLHIKVCQVVARELGISLNQVRISATRTDKVPNTSPTAASSGADLNAMAARNAALEIKQRLFQFAHEHYTLEPESIRLEDNIFHATTLAGDIFTLTWPELIQQVYLNRVPLFSEGFYATPKIGYDKKTARGRPFFYYAYGVAATEVEIDTLTGENRVRRVDILHDVGESLNPAIDRGQVEGGYIQGLGWLTTEELVWNDQGQLMTFGPSTYKIPAYSDAPIDFRVQLLEGHPNSEATIYHSKAVGEPPFMLAISAWAALRDAISSLSDYRINPVLDTPATPERILFACNNIREQHQERVST